MDCECLDSALAHFLESLKSPALDSVLPDILSLSLESALDFTPA
ncbi:hypothetical protein [uncultured Helicobacter sp.]